MTGFTCPSCGAHLTVSSSIAGGWKDGGTFEFPSGSAPADNFESWTRVTPTRAPTPAGDVVVPFLQSAITGGVVAALAGAGVAAWGWPLWAPVGAGTISLALSWGWLLLDHRSLLRITETIIGRDIDGDGQVGQQTLRVEMVEHRGPNSDRLQSTDLPCSADTMSIIAAGVLAGRPFSEKEWAGKGRPISGPKFRELQDVLLVGGYVRWNNAKDHRQGVAMTRKGEQLLREAVK